MIREVKFTNANPDYGSVYLIDPTVGNTQISIKNWLPSADIRMTRRPKMQMHGENPSDSHLSGMILHIEGDILYDTSEDYVTARQALLKGLLGDLRAPAPDVKMGTLSISFQFYPEGTFGFATPYGPFNVDVSMDGYPEIPLQALYPGASPYLLNFIMWTPYLTRGDDVYPPDWLSERIYP